MRLVQVLSMGKGDQRGLKKGLQKHRPPVAWLTGSTAFSGEAGRRRQEICRLAGPAWRACVSRWVGVPAVAQPQPGAGCWSLQVS